MSYIFLGMCVFVDFKCPDIKPYTVFSYLLTSTTSVIIILFSFLTSVIQIFLLFKNIILTKVYLVLSYNQHFSLFIFYYIFIFYFIVLIIYSKFLLVSVVAIFYKFLNCTLSSFNFSLLLFSWYKC